MLFNSRGFKEAASHKGQQLEQALIKASDGGKIPIVMDTSPCLAQMKGALTDPALRYFAFLTYGCSLIAFMQLSSFCASLTGGLSSYHTFVRSKLYGSVLFYPASWQGCCSNAGVPSRVRTWSG